ncbi:DUF397 domain-containing protein [Streptomyces xinghaiensis]|uniref:DUF397 domain-containing protein n=1 Tax=Streptomyces xinghaiensis TaxID=1038928 RepID=UPI0002F3920D|nr:DUF397 domain-containing protein [Streptomyces xinghaiensis]MZE76080.1 DUF397 domain-containing protein [Streptomyces sp. SID5475]
MKNAHRSMPDLPAVRWRSSTYSGGNNECVEVAGNIPGTVPVRDSKRPGGPVICFSRSAWSTFVDHLR